MSCVQIDKDRFRIDLGGGFGMEIILLFSQTVAFWLYGGELFQEAVVGET